ncbi:MAG TPA: ribosome recycling factor [Dehalococcoidia bacterium]|nr:ribosome recycling factor [Dehalococcoidia bacterium]
MIDDALKNCRTRMQKAVEALEHELATVRTGRASPALVEGLKVDYHDTPMPLKQLATISIPEARVIMIQPWDRQAIKLIEKAIQQSDLGLNPSNDGAVIRLNIPQLTEDRRKELAKLVKKRVEESRVAVRNIRRDIHEEVRALERDHKISKDDLHRAEQELQKITDGVIKEVDQVGERKEAEVLAV